MAGVLNVGSEMSIVRPIRKKPLPACCGHGIPNSDKIRRCPRSVAYLRGVSSPKICGALCRLRFVSGHPQPIHAGDRLVGDMPQGHRIQTDRISVLSFRRNAAELKNMGEAPGSVCSAAEAE